MNTYRARHDNVSESPVRTLYGRKGNFLLLPLDVRILHTINGVEEFRPSPEATRLIAQYAWSLTGGGTVDPVVLVQLAPSANVKGVKENDVQEYSGCL